MSWEEEQKRLDEEVKADFEGPLTYSIVLEENAHQKPMTYVSDLMAVGRHYMTKLEERITFYARHSMKFGSHVKVMRRALQQRERELRKAQGSLPRRERELQVEEALASLAIDLEDTEYLMKTCKDMKELLEQKHSSVKGALSDVRTQFAVMKETYGVRMPRDLPRSPQTGERVGRGVERGDEERVGRTGSPGVEDWDNI